MKRGAVKLLLLLGDPCVLSHVRVGTGAAGGKRCERFTASFENLAIP